MGQTGTTEQLSSPQRRAYKVNLTKVNFGSEEGAVLGQLIALLMATTASLPLVP